MFKKLDLLIIKAFIRPFFATFFIAVFVLTMQFFWLYIDDLVGKGLDVLTLAHLTGLAAVNWVPLALPLALLLSSIMTFGNLGESFELVAIKSAGIPLVRFMRPLFLVTLFIAAVSFLFSNYLLPVAALKFNTLKYNIIVSKPSFDIKEGVFYNKIEGYTIKIGQKSKDGSTIKNVVIFERSPYGLQDYSIAAESGSMKVIPGNKLEFDLKNGWRYEERGNRMSPNTELIRLGFREYKKVLDLSGFQMSKTSDSAFKDNYKMLSVRQLNKTIDSMHRTEVSIAQRATAEMQPLLNFIRYADTGLLAVDGKAVGSPKTISDIIPDSALTFVKEMARNKIASASAYASSIASDYTAKHEDLVNHEVEWHRKFTLSAACIILFLIGAPLGSIIRKGGLGTPLVFAVIFFVLFHLLNTFGEKFAKSDVLSPFAGMWMASLVLLPVSIFLTHKAMQDSQLFNQEYYFRLFKSLKNWRSKLLRKRGLMLREA